MATTMTRQKSTRDTPLSVQDRRQAALDRLAESGGTRTRPNPSQTRRQVSALQADATSAADRRRLDAPPWVWYGIIAVVIVFVMLGLVMVLSASAITQANLGKSPYHVFIRQSTWAGMGLIALAVVARIPYTFWQRLVVPIGIVGVALMAVPLAPGIGGTVNGARAWIFIGSFSIQPSEFLKLAVVIVAADLLTRRRNLLNHRRATLYPLGGIALIGTGLCMVQGDLGSAIVLGSIVLAIAWIAGVPFVPISVMTSGAIAAGLFFVVSSQTRIDRFTAFLDVTGNKDRLAWQTYQGYVSMASGGVGGSGIGGSRTKLGYLPYAHSDFIFAIIADELGLMGAGAVIGGFVMLVWFGIQTAVAAPDRFGMLVAGGVASWFGVQAIVNLGGVTGLMPVTGLTLPFFSAGGSSLFVSLIATGLLLSVARRIGSPGTLQQRTRQPRTRQQGTRQQGTRS
jgi:cell division protein FtsW